VRVTVVLHASDWRLLLPTFLVLVLGCLFLRWGWTHTNRTQSLFKAFGETLVAALRVANTAEPMDLTSVVFVAEGKKWRNQTIAKLSRYEPCTNAPCGRYGEAVDIVS
jgi:hypothetical protein